MKNYPFHWLLPDKKKYALSIEKEDEKSGEKLIFLFLIFKLGVRYIPFTNEEKVSKNWDTDR